MATDWTGLEAQMMTAAQAGADPATLENLLLEAIHDRLSGCC